MTTQSTSATAESAPAALSSPALVSSLRRHAVERPEQLAVVDNTTGESLTYADLADRVTALTGGLRQSGLTHGDRVGILALNSLPYVVLLLALADLGAIAVPQNTRLNPVEISANLTDAGVAAIACDEAFAEVGSRLADEIGVESRFLLAGGAPGWDPLPLAEGVPGDGAGRAPSGEDTCTLLYTSGTTGRAKGCMLAQRTWVGYGLNMAVSLRVGPTDVYLAFLPFFHVAGLGMMLSHLVMGGTVVTQPTGDAAQMHSAVERYGVTIVFFVPGVSAAFVNSPHAAEGASTLRLFVSAAGLEHQDVIDAVEQRLGVTYVGIYGQTESGTKTTWVTGEQHRELPGTYGTVMPTLSYRIVDAEDRDVPDGEPGELVLRGATMMQGYWNRPEATAEALRNGWHHTGDVFVHEGAGRLRMVDRTKYLIKTGGENVYPQEVENVLRTHPAVGDVAVIGIPDDHWGETVKACIVPRPDTEVTRAELDAFVRQSVAGYKTPRFIEFVTEIPRNVSGKILKNQLATRATDETQRVKRATA